MGVLEGVLASVTHIVASYLNNHLQVLVEKAELGIATELEKLFFPRHHLSLVKFFTSTTVEICKYPGENDFLSVVERLLADHNDTQLDGQLQETPVRRAT